GGAHSHRRPDRGGRSELGRDKSTPQCRGGRDRLRSWMRRGVSSQGGALAECQGGSRSAPAQRALRGVALTLLLLSWSSVPAGARADAPAYRVAVLELGIDNVSDSLARRLTERV